MKRYAAAVVGLGQVGLLFDDDLKRKGVWTHFRAYEYCRARFDLVAACDPDPLRRAKAQARLPSIRCYADIEDMLRAETLDVVSLCTPPDLHPSQIETFAGRVRAILCEKPLGGQSAKARAIVSACEQSGTLLVVNYYKRFDGCVPTVAEMIRSGALGSIRSATALYAGPLEAVGSHALDLLSFLIGPLTLKYAAKTGEDRHLAVLSFGAEGVATLQQTGPREELIFEIDIIGSAGRIRILDNCDRLEYGVFRPSDRYSGYQELRPATPSQRPGAERFVPLFEEVADHLDSLSSPLTSDGRSALATQILLEEILNAQ